ncbi:DUF3040 domain-containing protein [Actinocrispum wychmicini]|uniref:DUF3040 family protein n=1 Tax=Actinocrispum wychmicini TaxID=1213861 RepID=A0A4R2JB36_9PSEU|nr:DUF3040 domain-containing protein [Actinocrispum wychmicini]TCO56683.1 DUF3040 family protein [Actinocrispum wychmicini]
MPLSEHEQRLLDQIERALYAEDPKFASTVGRARLRRPSRRRRVQGAVLFVVGVALLVLGVVVQQFWFGGFPAVSLLGFLVMFFGALITLTAIRRGNDAPTDAASGKNPPRRSSFSQRMEERFRKRFEQD